MENQPDLYIAFQPVILPAVWQHPAAQDVIARPIQMIPVVRYPQENARPTIRMARDIRMFMIHHFKNFQTKLHS